LGKSGDEQLGLRLKEEAEWTEAMEGIMPDAIREVLFDRRDRLAELQRESMSVDNAKKFANVQAAIESRWISRDAKTRKISIDRDVIKNDVQTLIYLGPENGLRSLMTRDMGLNPPTEWNSATKQPQKYKYGGNGFKIPTYIELDDTDKALVDEACNGEMGEAYKKRLFTDFLTARENGGLSDKRIDIKVFGHGWEKTPGTLALKSHEEEILEQQYGAYLTAFAESTPKGKETVQSLKQQGVDKEKDHKKWLTAFLAAMIGIPVAAVGIATAGTGVAAIGAGVAALGAIRGTTDAI